MIEGLRVNRELLLEFFLTFSCFEFALKSAGFAIGDENSVSPDWDGYADSIKNVFNKAVNENLLNASNHLLDNPPMKQCRLPNGLAWNANMPSNNLTETEVILLLVRRVRNNLFHGGKHGIEAFEDPR